METPLPRPSVKPCDAAAAMRVSKNYQNVAATLAISKDVELGAKKLIVSASLLHLLKLPEGEAKKLCTWVLNNHTFLPKVAEMNSLVKARLHKLIRESFDAMQLQSRIARSLGDGDRANAIYDEYQSIKQQWIGDDSE